MCYGQNEMLMPLSLISLKTLLSSLCRKKAEVCAVAIFIIVIFTGIIGHTGDLIYGEDAEQRAIKKNVSGKNESRGLLEPLLSSRQVTVTACQVSPLP